MQFRLAMGFCLACLSVPAAATQGMMCEAKGASIDLLYGHAAVPGLLQATLEIGGKTVPTEIAQSWSADNVIMIDLADPDQMAVLARIRLKWANQTWRGTLVHGKRTYQLKCGEAG